MSSCHDDRCVSGSFHSSSLLCPAWNVAFRRPALSCSGRKEGLADYRYFPEPDLPPAEVSEQMLEEVGGALPELPEARRKRYIGYGANAQSSVPSNVLRV